MLSFLWNPFTVDFFYLEFHFCLGLFLVSSNVYPRLCLLIVSALYTFSCLKSIFMVIKHFLEVFKWNHVMRFRGSFVYLMMGVRGRFLYPIFFLGCWYGYLVICEYLIFEYLTFCWNVDVCWFGYEIFCYCIVIHLSFFLDRKGEIVALCLFLG